MITKDDSKLDCALNCICIYTLHQISVYIIMYL